MSDLEEITDPVSERMKGVKCAYCGNQADKYSSGSAECWKCWNVRKLVMPAASFWNEGIDYLFAHDGGSGPDQIDWEMWDRWGLMEEMSKALHTLRAVGQAYAEIVANPRPWAKEKEVKEVG